MAIIIGNNIVRFGPVTLEFTMLECAQQASIILLGLS